MSRSFNQYPYGATSLDPNEKDGLIPQFITTQEELNILERENILEAANWALGNKNHDFMNISFCLDLHKRMFLRVWRWAGQPRTTDKNIGVPKEQIFEKLKLLFDNTHFWIQNHTYPFDEIGVRFHHQLVAIHPFPNGNGRHARLMTDILLKRNKHKPFTWGKADLCGPRSRVRKEYIESLKLADQKDFKKLLKFVRS